MTIRERGEKSSNKMYSQRFNNLTRSSGTRKCTGGSGDHTVIIRRHPLDILSHRWKLIWHLSGPGKYHQECHIDRPMLCNASRRTKL